MTVTDTLEGPATIFGYVAGVDPPPTNVYRCDARITRQDGMLLIEHSFASVVGLRFPFRPEEFVIVPEGSSFTMEVDVPEGIPFGLIARQPMAEHRWGFA